MGNFTIREGRKSDAPFIGQTVAGALGHELCCSLAEGEDNLPTVVRLFTELAALEESQYSYRNTLLAVNETGDVIGALVSYDGAELLTLRKAFIEKANELLGWNVTHDEVEQWEPETTPDEVYLDSLYVVPAYRNQGVATALIKVAIKRYEGTHKPYGLLVDPENTKGRALYEQLGFKQEGINCFCGIPMHHMVYAVG